MSSLLIVVAWNVSAFLAMLAHLYAAIDARRDLTSARAATARVQSLVLLAQGNLGISLALAGVQAVDLLLGVLAISERASNPIPASTAPPSDLAILITLGLVSQELMLLAISFAIVAFRHRLRVVVRRELSELRTAVGLANAQQ